MNREHRHPLARPPSAPLIPLHQFSITKKSLLCHRHSYRGSFFGRLWLYLYTRSSIFLHIAFHTRASPVLAHKNVSPQERQIYFLIFVNPCVCIEHEIIQLSILYERLETNLLIKNDRVINFYVSGNPASIFLKEEQRYVCSRCVILNFKYQYIEVNGAK